ncbi:hypothetical protein [Parapedobacter tibetensis]|uniref:hypothetical protein n=1 Tax=Parapedobacter tibetensis TaxID=2972951 RepID=UPI00214DB49C|nr:hypothetical protein [Parapedobacter tibetensis]
MNKRYKPFWYDTGTPTFLLKLLNTEAILETVPKDRISVSDTFTNRQPIGRMDAIAFLARPRCKRGR